MVVTNRRDFKYVLVGVSPCRSHDSAGKIPATFVYLHVLVDVDRVHRVHRFTGLCFKNIPGLENQEFELEQ